MPFEKFSKSYFGSNYEKAKRNYESAVEREKLKFKREYPDANVNDFLFDADLNASGDVIRSFTQYKKQETGELFEITGYLFKKNFENLLYWTPRIWGTAGTIQPFVKNPSTDLNVNAFRIYVTNDLFFDANLPKLEIRNNENSNDYKDNPYLAALFAAYIATYSCGISEEHFDYNGPKIISSIARYHLYFHMRRFIRQPSKMSKYITREMETIVLNNKPVVYKWTKEFHSGREQLNFWLSKQPRGTIRDARVVMSSYNTGQLGISYMKRGAQTIRSLEDYKLFVASKSNGLTKTGQLLFQQSIESFVYCVLGA